MEMAIIENNVTPKSALKSSPSVLKKFSFKLERDVRIRGCVLIKSVCLLMELPQNTAATAQTLLHRFFFVESIGAVPLFDLLAACIYLATKLEETHKRISSIILCLDSLRPNSNIKYGSHEYFEYREGVILAEVMILARLGFDVHVEHGHGYLFNYLSSMSLNEIPLFCQSALDYLNDSYCTIVSVLYQPHIIACGIIYFTALKLDVNLPVDWFKVFDAEIEDMIIITKLMLELYSIKPSDISIIDLDTQLKPGQQLQS